MARLAVFVAVLLAAGQAIGAITIGGPVGPNGVEVVCDLPVECRKVNIASKGLGCCVFRSLDHASRWQNVPQLHGMPEWMVKSGIEGGGYPDKVARLIPQISKDRGMETPLYVNHTGGDPSVLEALLASGRMPCITYCGRDQHYQGKSIAHMVNLIYMDKDQCAVLDNNYIGEKEIVWMSRKEFLERWRGNGGGWCVGLLQSAPAPVPHLN